MRAQLRLLAKMRQGLAGVLGTAPASLAGFLKNLAGTAAYRLPTELGRDDVVTRRIDVAKTELPTPFRELGDIANHVQSEQLVPIEFGLIGHAISV